MELRPGSLHTSDLSRCAVIFFPCLSIAKRKKETKKKRKMHTQPDCGVASPRTRAAIGPMAGSGTLPLRIQDRSKRISSSSSSMNSQHSRMRTAGDGQEESTVEPRRRPLTGGAALPRCSPPFTAPSKRRPTTQGNATTRTMAPCCSELTGEGKTHHLFLPSFLSRSVFSLSFLSSFSFSLSSSSSLFLLLPTVALKREKESLTSSLGALQHLWGRRGRL